LIREFEAGNEPGSPLFAKKETVKHSDSVSSVPLKSQGAVLPKQEREKGQAWVEREINRAARECGVKLIEPVEWKDDFKGDAYWVRIATSDGLQKRWKFSYDQLEDLVNVMRVRRELEKAIAFVIPDGPECEIPDRLKRWHGVELHQSTGYQKLLTALRSRSRNVGIQFPAT
jgi:hypothetical protein